MKLRSTAYAPVSVWVYLQVYWRFDVGVGEPVDVHGGKVSTAYDAPYQARLLGVVLKRNHDASSLLQGLVFCLVDLQQ